MAVSMNTVELIKALPLVPQFQGLLRDLRNLVNKFGQAEQDIPSLDSQVNTLKSTVQTLERELQEMREQLRLVRLKENRNA